MPRGIYDRKKSPRNAAKLAKVETKKSTTPAPLSNLVSLVYRAEVKVWRSDSEELLGHHLSMAEFEQLRTDAVRFQIPLIEEGE